MRKSVPQDDFVPAATIVDYLRVAQVVDLDAFIAGYGDRVLVHAQRQMAVVRGTGCSTDALTAVVFLSPAATARLTALGAGSFADFLSEKEERNS